VIIGAATLKQAALHAGTMRRDAMRYYQTTDLNNYYHLQRFSSHHFPIPNLFNKRPPFNNRQHNQCQSDRSASRPHRHSHHSEEPQAPSHSANQQTQQRQPHRHSEALVWVVLLPPPPPAAAVAVCQWHCIEAESLDVVVGYCRVCIVTRVIAS
jgi:hypothetical protein